jgi:hypothetical protein
MLKSFETVSAADHMQLAAKLNELLQYCFLIDVHNIMATMTQLQQVVLIALIEVQFDSEEQRDNFEKKLRPKVTLNKS